MGAKLELCAMGALLGPEARLEWMRHWRRVKVEETAAAVQTGFTFTVPRAGHALMLDNPMSVAGLIDDVLRREDSVAT